MPSSAPESPFPPRRLEVVPRRDTRAERVTTLRYFEGNVHRVAALATVEGLVAWASVVAIATLAVPPLADAALPVPPWQLGLLLSAGMMIALSSMGLYRLRQRVQMRGVLARLLVAAGGVFAGLELAYLLVPALEPARVTLLNAAVIALPGLALARFSFSRVVDQDVFKRRVLVWGAGARAASIGTRMRRRTDQRGFLVVGYVGAPSEAVCVPADMLVGREGDLVDFVLRNGVHEVVVAMDDRRAGFPSEFLMECRLRGISVCDIVDFLERETGRVSVELARPSHLIYADGFRSDFVRTAGKRAFDIAASLALLAAALPFMLLAALAIKLEDGGPVFYRQTRTGQGGRPFRMVKFRSMSVDAERGGKAIWAVRNDPRVTRVGEFIRKVRIDELPQAFNVLVGDMSFVGPRPERPEFVQTLASKIPFYDERHFVKPGITGWAQVRYPYGASEDDAREKLGYDLYYVKKHSLAFDFMVLLQTVEIVLFRIGSR